MSVMVTIFSNDKTARPSTLLKTESTTDILIGQVDIFRKAVLKNTCERLRVF